MSILLWLHILNTVYSFIHHLLSEIINCLTFNNSGAAVGNQDVGAFIGSGSTTGLRTEGSHIKERLCLAEISPFLSWNDIHCSVSQPSNALLIVSNVSYYAFFISPLFETQNALDGRNNVFE